MEKDEPRSPGNETPTCETPGLSRGLLAAVPAERAAKRNAFGDPGTAVLHSTLDPFSHGFTLSRTFSNFLTHSLTFSDFLQLSLTSSNLL